jgi:hypothetical protein
MLMQFGGEQGDSGGHEGCCSHTHNEIEAQPACACRRRGAGKAAGRALVLDVLVEGPQAALETWIEVNHR